MSNSNLQSRLHKRLVACIFLTIITSICTQTDAQWSHWLGDNRNGKTSQESGWDGTKWRISEPVWERQLGVGSSSPLVIDGQVITFSWNGSGKNGKETLSSFDLATGNPLWEQAYDAPLYGRHSVGDKSLYSGPSATPEYDPESGLLFTMGTDGDLRCWNFVEKGKPVWQINLYDQYSAGRRPNVGRAQQRDYGYTTSPIVFKEWLLVEVGSSATGNLIAFAKKTGKQVWGSESKDLAGHSGGPVMIQLDGVPCAAVLALENLVVTRLDADNAGKTVGVFPWTTDFANNIATPAVHENSVIVSSAYNHYATCRVDFSLKEGAKKVWENKKDCTGVCSPIIDNGNIYWSWRGVHCLDFETGALKWKGGKTNEAGSCVLTGDQRLIVWAKRGELLLTESAERSQTYQQIDSRQILSKTDAWPHVVVADGHILCRDRGGSLVCLQIGE